MMRRRGAARRGSKLPRHCHPLGEAETISLWEILLIGSSRGLRPSRAHPGAERTDSPPHHPFSDSAEILRISGRGICKEAIFSPGGKPPLRKNQRPGATNRNLRFRLVGREATCLPFGQATFPPRRSPASIGSREGSHLLELSGAVLMEKLISDEAGCPLGDTVPDGAGVGRSAPLLPDGVREGCDPLALSRGCSGGDIGSRRCRLSFGGHCFRRGRLFS